MGAGASSPTKARPQPQPQHPSSRREAQRKEAGDAFPDAVKPFGSGFATERDTRSAMKGNIMDNLATRSSNRMEEVITAAAGSFNYRRRVSRRRRFGYAATYGYEREQRSSAVGRPAPDREEVEWLVSRLEEQNQVFRFLQPAMKRRVAGAMRQQRVNRGEVLFRQHDQVTQDCFVVGEGVLEEYREDDAAHPKLLETGKLFGELALLYQSPRNTTVRAKTSAIVWALSRAAYYAGLTDGGKAMQRDLLVQLRSQVPFFSHAPGKRLAILALTLEKVNVKEGAPVRPEPVELEAAGGMVYFQTGQPESEPLTLNGEPIPAQTLVAVCSEAEAAALSADVNAWNKQHVEFLQALGELHAIRRASREDLSKSFSSAGESALCEGSFSSDLGQIVREKSEGSFVSQAALRLTETTEVADLEELILQQERDSRLFSDLEEAILAEHTREQAIGHGSALWPVIEGAAPSSGDASSKDECTALAPLTVETQGSSSPKKGSPAPPQRVRGLQRPLRVVICSAGEADAHLPTTGAGGATLHKVGLARFRLLCGRLYEIADGFQGLRHLPLFAGMTVETFGALDRMFSERRTYAPGDKIVQQGAVGEELFLVISGEVVVTLKPDPDADPSASTPASSASVTVCTRLHAGDFFGEYGALDGRPRTATVTAATSCTCAVLRRGANSVLPSELIAHLRNLREACNYKSSSSALKFGDLEYITDLGQGGYGTVVLCKHTPTGSAVAVKVMLRENIRSDRQRENVLGERQRLLELRHPFIVRMLGTFKDSVRLMVAMEFVSGGELFSLLEQMGSLSHEQAIFVLASVTLMLEHIHSRDFVYRDLKPENVMLSSDGFLKLVDFGFCKRLPASEHAFTPCGTPEYVAPEIATLQGYGREVDWWGTGILVYDCLHGYTPFTKQGTIESDMVIMGNIREASYPIEFEPHVMLAVQEVCRGLLQHSRSARFGAAQVRSSAACATIDFQRLLNKQLRPAFAPVVRDPFDTSNFTPDVDEGCSGAELLAMRPDSKSIECIQWDEEF